MTSAVVGEEAKPKKAARRGIGSLATIAIPVLVALFALKIACGELGTADIGFDDEAAALEHGLTMTMPTADWAPLYSLWYAALSVGIKDPANIYYANWFVLVTALPVLLYVLARRLGAPLVSSTIVAIVWTLGHALRTWPFVTLFATVIIASGAIVVSHARTWSRALAVTSATMAIASFVRPEIAAPALVLAVVGVGFAAIAARRREATIASTLEGALAIVPLIVLRSFFGNPMSGDRSGFAFGQHYALNRVEAFDLGIDPWTNWSPIYRQAFPLAGSPLAAARENPAQFEWHVMRNAGLVVREVSRFIEPLDYLPRVIAVTCDILLLVVVACGLAAVLGPRRRQVLERTAKILPLVAVVMATTLGALLIVRPRQHYLVTASFLALAAFAGASVVVADAARRRWASRIDRWDVRISFALSSLVLVLAPTFSPGRIPALLRPDGPPPSAQFAGYEAVKILRALKLKGPITILESSYSRALYAGLRFKCVTQVEKETPFWQFIHDKGIDVVVVDDRLRRDRRFGDDDEFKAFQDGRARQDFRFFSVPAVHLDVAIRESLAREYE